jgi:hypothetical protein
MSVVFEESLVSIVRSEGVSIAYPSSLSKAELACVLHGLAGALFQAEIASGSGELAALPERNGASRFEGLEITDPAEAEIQVPQGANRRTLDDRRKWPRKKVVKRLKKGKVEVLSCGHKLAVPSNWKRHGSRACQQCALVTS